MENRSYHNQSLDIRLEFRCALDCAVQRCTAQLQVCHSCVERGAAGVADPLRGRHHIDEQRAVGLQQVMFHSALLVSSQFRLTFELFPNWLSCFVILFDCNDL